MDSSHTLYIRIKVVPGASRNTIAGLLGDRLKVRTNAPPEDGKANKAVCKFLAEALGIKPAQIQVHRGHTNPEKTISINGCTLDDIASSLNIDADELIMIALDKV